MRKSESGLWVPEKFAIRRSTRRDVLRYAGGVLVAAMLPRQAHAATFALVGTPSVQNAQTPTSTVTMDTTGADLLIIAAASWSGSGETCVISADSKGNTWTGLTRSGNPSIQIFYCKPSSVGASHGVTFNSSGTFQFACVFAGFSGAAASPYEQEKTPVGTVSPTSLTPSQ